MSIEKCQQLLSAEFKSDEFIEFEIKFYNDPEYSMNFTTPYDYLGLYQTAFPINDKQSERTIFFIDLALSIPELMFYSSKDIFFACLLLALKPNETEKAWILSQTFAPYKPLEAS